MTTGLPSTKATYTIEKGDVFLRRLKGVEGNVREAAQSLGLTLTQVNYWLKHHPEFKEAYRRVRAEVKG